jgi:hypothetical protein
MAPNGIDIVACSPSGAKSNGKRACPVWHPVRRDTRSAHSRQLLRAALRAEGTSLRCIGRSGKLSGPGAVVFRNKSGQHRLGL